MNFPRKRVPIACNFCRHRKRRCDGRKPVCGHCADAGADCEYQELAGLDRRESDGSQGELLRRIGELEHLLRQHNDVLTRSQRPGDPDGLDEPRASDRFSSTSATPSAAPSLASPFLTGSVATAEPALLPYSDSPTATGQEFQPGSVPTSTPTENHSQSMLLPETGGKDALPEQNIPLTIPIGHQTATASLFAAEKIKNLIGEYPEDFFYQIESQRTLNLFPVRPMPEFLATLDFTRGTADVLVANFFSHVHPSLPLLADEYFYPIYNGVMSTGPREDSQTALCLVVLALGSLSESPGFETSSNLAYFSAAYELLTAQWMTHFGTDMALPFALVYASVYLSYMVMPLQAWKLVHMASTSLQLLNVQLQGSQVPQNECAGFGRLCWACFLLECDGLAEFHLPRSGIELLIDGMPFPHFSKHSDRDGLVFLAVCSVRRLLNRIHSTVYDTPRRTPSSTSSAGFYDAVASPMPPTSPSAKILEHVCAELERQLDTWYKSLPDLIKPDLDSHVPHDIQDGWLRLRYWSAKHIIFRPCVLYVTSLPETNSLPPPHILESCKTCLESCRNFVATATFLLEERNQYTWMIIQAVLACALVLANASTSSLLKHLVPDIAELLGKVIDSVHVWAAPDSSAEAALCILQTVRQKQRVKRFSH